MKCKHIQKYIISQLDGFLPSEKTDRFQEHLNNCAECRDIHKKVSSIWTDAFEIQPIKPDLTMWQDLQSRINQFEDTRNHPQNLQKGLQFAFSAICILIGIGVGIFLGSEPSTIETTLPRNTPRVRKTSPSFESEFVEFLNPMPKSSLTGAYYSLAAESYKEGNHE